MIKNTDKSLVFQNLWDNTDAAGFNADLLSEFEDERKNQSNESTNSFYSKRLNLFISNRLKFDSARSQDLGTRLDEIKGCDTPQKYLTLSREAVLFFLLERSEDVASCLELRPYWDNLFLISMIDKIATSQKPDVMQNFISLGLSTETFSIMDEDLTSEGRQLDLLEQVNKYPALADPMLSVLREACFADMVWLGVTWPTELEELIINMKDKTKSEITEKIKSVAEKVNGSKEMIQQEFHDRIELSRLNLAHLQIAHLQMAWVIAALADCSDHDSHWWSLKLVIREGDISGLKLLLDNGRKVNGRDRNDDTLLELAVGQGCADSIKLLLAKGANPNDGSLRCAVKKGRVDIAGLLLEAGADIHERGGPRNRTALDLAAMEKDIAVVAFLLEKGAASKPKDSFDNDTALKFALIRGSWKIFRMLVQNNYIDLDVMGHQLLCLAVTQGSLEIARILVENGINPKKPINEHGQTYLHMAAMYGCSELVQMLLDQGENVDVQDEYGQTPLHSLISLYNNHLEPQREHCLKTLRLLLERGAKVDEKILAMAEKYGQRECVKILKEHLASHPNAQGSKLFQPKIKEASTSKSEPHPGFSL